MDNKKSYPSFTKKQFTFILETIKDRVYKSNIIMLKDNIYKFRYDINKVELAYSIFKRICLYYSITPNIEMFCCYSGIEKNLLVEWLNSGKSKIIAKMLDDTEAIDNFSMLNSDNSLLRVYHRNNRRLERLEEGTEAGLPDLLLTDQTQKALTEDKDDN